MPVSSASSKVSSSVVLTLLWPDHGVIAQVGCHRRSAVSIGIGQGRFAPFSIFRLLHSMALGLVDQSGRVSASHTSVTPATSLHVPAKLHVPANFQIFSSNCDRLNVTFHNFPAVRGFGISLDKEATTRGLSTGTYLGMLNGAHDY